MRFALRDGRLPETRPPAGPGAVPRALRPRLSEGGAIRVRRAGLPAESGTVPRRWLRRAFRRHESRRAATFRPDRPDETGRTKPTGKASGRYFGQRPPAGVAGRRAEIYDSALRGEGCPRW